MTLSEMDTKMIAAFNNTNPKNSRRRFLKRPPPLDDANTEPPKKKTLTPTKIDKSDPDFYLFNTTLSKAEKDEIHKLGIVYEYTNKNATNKVDIPVCPRCKNKNGCPDDFCYILDMDGKWVNPMIIELH